jgi:hypothetical protein
VADKPNEQGDQRVNNQFLVLPTIQGQNPFFLSNKTIVEGLQKATVLSVSVNAFSGWPAGKVFTSRLPNGRGDEPCPCPSGM